ncbi:MAG: HD domain-containing phosphohydrolase [Sulfuricellaceae bacterium]
MLPSKVAIIDDTELNLKLFNQLMKKFEACEVFCFQNSAEGLAWCIQNTPDLIIVDYMMPAPDGLEFIRRFRAEAPDGKDIPILMITANDQKEVRYKSLGVGANDFLTKPVDTSEFTARIKNMLALRESQKNLADRAAWLAGEVDKATMQIRAREKEIILRLSKATDYRDPETGAHILRMAHYARHIAVNLGLSLADQELILEAAPMHDIGKVGVPDHILLKPGKYEPEEFEIMKQHSRIGYEILAGSTASVLQAGAEIALTHHEKFDGTGYPDGLRGEAIPLFGRISAVADVFDALTSVRPYKAAWEIERAVELLRDEAGRHFDATCVDAFLANWENVLAIRGNIRDGVSIDDLL